jgi:hypothetical protein
MTLLRETDLYPPVRDFLLAQGFTVRGEVAHCDLAAVRGEELILIELKRSLTLTLLAQAARRQRVCPSVYVAVPRPPDLRRWKRQQKDVLHLLRRLELGLLLVSAAHVDIVFHPLPAERRVQGAGRRAVLREVAARSVDGNLGGSTRRKLLTAYREQALLVACALESGPATPKALRARGTGPKTLAILYRNVYGWFTRVDRGLYALTPAGQAALAEFPAPVASCRTRLAECEGNG